jgi:hypothetical protein
MADNLTTQVRSIADVTKAVARGDMTKRIEVQVQGEILELKETVNNMTDSLSIFAKEVTRVAREVGTEGKLGGQATVEGVAGIWKDLTDCVNTMALNVRLSSLLRPASVLSFCRSPCKCGASQSRRQVAVLLDDFRFLRDPISDGRRGGPTQ